MPVYNGERFIKAAIESILNQTFTNFELIILNDGSTDKTLSIIKSFSDPRIRLIQNDEKSGLAHIRNKAIAASRGEYIALLDSDDISYSNRLQKQVDFLNSNPQHCLVSSWTDIINSDGKLIDKQAYLYTDKEIQIRLFFHNCIAQSSVMLRKSMLPSISPYDTSFPPAEDYHLWVRMAARYQMHIIKEPLIQYRVHDANTLTGNREATDKAVKDILKYQLECLGFTNVSDCEINVHLALVYNTYSVDRHFIKRANQYFSKILVANKKYKYMAQQDLKAAIKLYMQLPLKPFFLTENRGVKLLRDLYGKSLNASKYLETSEIIQLIIKSFRAKM